MAAMGNNPAMPYLTAYGRNALLQCVDSVCQVLQQHDHSGDGLLEDVT